MNTKKEYVICANLHRSERNISLVEVIWKYHIAFHCWTAWSCVLHTFAAFPPSPSLGPRSFATRFRKGLVFQNLPISRTAVQRRSASSGYPALQVAAFLFGLGLGLGVRAAQLAPHVCFRGHVERFMFGKFKIADFVFAPLASAVSGVARELAHGCREDMLKAAELQEFPQFCRNGRKSRKVAGSQCIFKR